MECLDVMRIRKSKVIMDGKKNISSNLCAGIETILHKKYILAFREYSEWAKQIMLCFLAMQIVEGFQFIHYYQWKT